ncbi:LamG domain-containing protein, partial [Candidatus Poribacteria bacterium]|nr:LamG domain-containing protein [Candidatus Poribacteria bacterium]
MKTRNFLAFGLVFAFAFVLFAKPGYSAIDPKSIIGIWLLNENKDNIAIDSSKNGNNGELKNGAKWGNGKFGTALELNGLGAHVEFGVNDNLKPQQFTIVSWFNTRKINGYGHIFQSGKDWSDIAGIVFRVHQDGYFQAAMATAPGNTASWVNGPNLSTKTWYHAALTFDGTTLLLYIDGEKVANAGGGKILYNNRTVR